VAATHSDVESRIADGLFREDLYYRLCVFPIQLPPLRERNGDLPLLIDYFQTRLGAHGTSPAGFSPGAFAALENHDWPGNVRELGNLVERMSITHGGGQVQLADLPERYRRDSDGDALPAVAAETRAGTARAPFEERAIPTMPDDGLDLKNYLCNLETALLRQALQQAGGTVARAARLLNLRRTTLVEKMKKYGMDSSDF
jgi:sigma-54 specific flagellar transcriptional regulator A